MFTSKSRFCHSSVLISILLCFWCFSFPLKFAFLISISRREKEKMKQQLYVVGVVSFSMTGVCTVSWRKKKESLAIHCLFAFKKTFHGRAQSSSIIGVCTLHEERRKSASLNNGAILRLKKSFCDRLVPRYKESLSVFDGFTEWARIEWIEKENRLMTEILHPPPPPKKKSSAVNHLMGVDTSAGHTNKILFMPHIVSIALARKVCAAGYSDGVPLSKAHNRGLTWPTVLLVPVSTVTLPSLCLPAVHCPGSNTSARQTLEHRGFKGADWFTTSVHWYHF